MGHKYTEEMEREEQELARAANEMVREYGLRAEVFPGVRSVGVQGDDRTYTPAINLIGPHPGNQKLKEISTRLTNELRINRVTFQVAERGEPSG